MTKKEFIALYAERANFETKVDAEKKLDAVLNLFEEILIKGDEINFVGWGKFEVKDTPARVGRNPKTGVEVEIPAKRLLNSKQEKL